MLHLYDEVLDQIRKLIEDMIVQGLEPVMIAFVAPNGDVTTLTRGDVDLDRLLEQLIGQRPGESLQ